MKLLIKIIILAVMAAAVLAACGRANKTANQAETKPTAAPAAETTAEPSLTDNKDHITITLETGDVIKAELYPDVAPITVKNFEKLISEKFYDGLIFHRVIAGFMIQGGDPEGSGMGGPGYSIKGEFNYNGVENNLKHSRGVLSMARAQHPDSAGSQFFIMHADAPHLDGQYAAFGKLVEGEDVLDSIASIDTDWSDRPRTPQVMKTVTVDTFGVDYAEPETL